MRRNLAKEKLAAGKPISVVAPSYTSAGLVELGLRPGDKVVLFSENRPEWVSWRTSSGSWPGPHSFFAAARVSSTSRAKPPSVSSVSRSWDRFERPSARTAAATPATASLATRGIASPQKSPRSG